MDNFFLKTHFQPSPKPLAQYDGDKNENSIRNGNGIEIWSTASWNQRYDGRFFRDSIHGKGCYTWKHYSVKSAYEGSMYANHLCGYGTLSLSKGGTFEGLFKNSRRFGPGVETHPNSTQDVGFWKAKDLVRICHYLDDELVPRIAKTPLGKLMLLRHRRIIDIDRDTENIPFKILQEFEADKDILANSSLLYAKHIRDEKSLFFDKKAHDFSVFGIDPKLTIDVALTEDELYELELKITNKFKEEHKMWAEIYKRSEDSRISSTGDFIQINVSNGFIVNSEIDDGRSEILYEYTYSVDDMSIERYFKISNYAEDSIPKEPQMPPIPMTKKVIVNQLIAWNNNELSIAFLRHVFRYRNLEADVSFCVADILAGYRSHFSSPGDLERLSMEFLNDTVYRYIEHTHFGESICPSVCDARGNGALMLATVRDNLLMIAALSQEGVIMDHLNDEGFSALTMSITRYLAVQYDVTVWEKAFLPVLYKEEISPAESPQKWRRNLSFASLLNMQSGDENLCSDKHIRKPYIIGEHQPVNIEMFGEGYYGLQHPILLSMDQLVFRHLPAFSQSNTSDVENIDSLMKTQKFLFDLTRPTLKAKRGKKGKKEKKEKKVKKEKKQKTDKKQKKGKQVKIPVRDKSPKAKKVKPKTPEEERIEREQAEKEQKLEIIMDTILKLLENGANPDKATVPLPALLLSLFTKQHSLLLAILNADANPNITNLRDEGSLTALHMLASMPPSLIVIIQFGMLVNCNADTNIRAYPPNETKDRVYLLQGRKTEDIEHVELGQTPLHMLCLRADTEQAAVKHNKALIYILIRNGADPGARYLGHCGLSLAIRNGQIPLVVEMLSSELVNPNEDLRGDLGLPLCVMMSMKTQAKMDSGVIKELMNLLVTYCANPFICPKFNKGFQGNVVDFSSRQINPNVRVQGGRKKEKQQNKTNTDKKGKGKGGKGNEFKNILTEFRDISRNYHLKHLYGKMLIQLIGLFTLKFMLDDQSIYTRDNMLLFNVNNDIILRCFWITVDALEQCLRLFMRMQRLICDRRTISNIITFNQKIKYSPQYAMNERGIQQKQLIMRELNTMSRQIKRRKVPDLLPFSIVRLAPEIDEMEGRYNVCFECSERFEKTLELCPICRLVKFCSEKCKEENKKRGIHICDADIPFRRYGETDEEYFKRLHKHYEENPVGWPGDETDAERDKRLKALGRGKGKGKGKRKGRSKSRKSSKSKRSKSKKSGDGSSKSSKSREGSGKKRTRDKSGARKDTTSEIEEDVGEKGKRSKKKKEDQKEIVEEKGKSKKILDETDEEYDTRQREEEEAKQVAGNLFDLSLWALEGIDLCKMPYVVLCNGNLYYRHIVNEPVLIENYSLN